MVRDIHTANPYDGTSAVIDKTLFDPIYDFTDLDEQEIVFDGTDWVVDGQSEAVSCLPMLSSGFILCTICNWSVQVSKQRICLVQGGSMALPNWLVKPIA